MGPLNEMLCEAITAQLYNTIKLVTETELGTFTTQFLNYSNKKGIQAVA